MISYKVIPVVEMQIKTFQKWVNSPLPDRKATFRNGNRKVTLLSCSEKGISPFFIANVQYTPGPGDTFTFEEGNGKQYKVLITENRTKAAKYIK